VRVQVHECDTLQTVAPVDAAMSYLPKVASPRNKVVGEINFNLSKTCLVGRFGSCYYQTSEG